MVKRSRFWFLTLLSGAILSVCVSPQPRAATSSSLDVLPVDRTGDGSESVDVGGLKPLARPNREPARAMQSGNPLWSVPLSILTATVARPLFSASRRPPQPAVVAPPTESAIKPPPAPAVPDRPALALIGAVVGDDDAIAVFIDQTTQKIVRLRQGDTHAGWQLSAVQGREVTFKKGGRSEVLTLQRQQGTAAAPARSPTMPAPQPVAGALDGSYAPFTPRSTPKNGEPDGL